MTRKAYPSSSEVTLAPLGPEHAEAMLRWMSDPEVSGNMGLRSEPTRGRTEDWITQALADDTVRPFAILRAGRHVGNVVLDRLDTHLGTARLSVYIGDPADRGKGTGRSAIRLAYREAFEKLGLTKVWATVHVRNLASAAAFCSAGFCLEGIHRDEFILDGERLAVLYLGLTREDWLRPPDAES